VEAVEALWLAAMLLHSLMSAWVCCELCPFIGTTDCAHPGLLKIDNAIHRLTGENLFMMTSGRLATTGKPLGRLAAASDAMRRLPIGWSN